MNPLERKMNILMALPGFSIVKENETKAQWHVVSGAQLNIDVSFPPELWELKYKGKMMAWTGIECPNSIRSMIGALVEDFKKADDLDMIEDTAIPANAPQEASGKQPVNCPEEVDKPEEKKSTANPTKNGNGTQTKKQKGNSKNQVNEEKLKRFGLELPIIYPPEMEGKFMKFNQWRKDNNVIPAESGVLILDEDEYNYTVHIPSAHIGFTIGRSKVEVI